MNEPVVLAAAELETPVERAQRRAAALAASVTDVLRTLADMYRDEDWRHLTDSRGNPYTGFTAFLQDHLGGSSSNARRYQQGITGLILPLQQLTTPETLIPITSADIARLGQPGAQAVIEEAPEVLDGLDEPTDQTQALRGLIDRIAQRKLSSGPRPEPAAGSLVPSAIPAAIGAGSVGEPSQRADADHSTWHDAAPSDELPSPVAPPWADVVSEGSAPAQESPGLNEVIAEILRCDPVASAQTATPADRATLASAAIAAAHKLSRYGQLLQSLTPSGGGQAPSPVMGDS
jgi:hypothetical protein